MVRVPYVKLNGVHWRTHYVKFPSLNFQSTNLNWSMVSMSRNQWNPWCQPRWPTFRDGSTKWSALPIFFIPTWRAWGRDFLDDPPGTIEKNASEIQLGFPREILEPPQAIPGPALGDVREECCNATGLGRWGECCPMTYPSESKFCPKTCSNMSWKHYF